MSLTVNLNFVLFVDTISHEVNSVQFMHQYFDVVGLRSRGSCNNNS